MATGWRNWSEILGLNRPVADAMAENVAGNVQMGAEEALAGLAGAEAEHGRQLRAAESAPMAEGATFAGPDALSALPNWAQLLSQAGTAQDKATLTGSTGGVQTLLSDLYGKPFTQGGGIFDAALTGSAGAGQFDALRGQFGNLRGRFLEADKAAKGRADASREAFAKALEQWRNRPPPAAAAPPPAQFMPPPPVSQPPGMTRGSGQVNPPSSFLPEERMKPLRPGQEMPAGPSFQPPQQVQPPSLQPAQKQRKSTKFGTFGRDF